MTTREKILPFCSVDALKYPHLRAPICYSGFIYANDGRISVRTKTDSPDTPEADVAPRKLSDFEGLYRKYPGEFNRLGGPVWKDMPPLVDQMRDIYLCQDCSGHGTYFEMSPDKTKRELTCEHCAGRGEIDKAPATTQKISTQEQGGTNATFDVRFLHRVKALRGNLKIAVLSPSMPLWFIVDNGEFEGFVMPIRTE